LGRIFIAREGVSFYNHAFISGQEKVFARKCRMDFLEEGGCFS
jgi:hypothetical protein